MKNNLSHKSVSKGFNGLNPFQHEEEKLLHILSIVGYYSAVMAYEGLVGITADTTCSFSIIGRRKETEMGNWVTHQVFTVDVCPLYASKNECQC